MAVARDHVTPALLCRAFVSRGVVVPVALVVVEDVVAIVNLVVVSRW